MCRLSHLPSATINAKSCMHSRFDARHISGDAKSLSTLTAREVEVNTRSRESLIMQSRFQTQLEFACKPQRSCTPSCKCKCRASCSSVSLDIKLPSASPYSSALRPPPRYYCLDISPHPTSTFNSRNKLRINERLMHFTA